ncbi:SpoIIE family protein phosphatase [Streptomyces sp. MI02-7b]|uniref:SpoIIE family protein phosphatase n=1 Tax=Streptomyces sp. MI02-7b TaxID=462941 RepID=UPI0029BC38A1|nr:SpoIIE family protein phosphatase [Streptomyces sp. MI02-7b]MDX3077807.1 SpoIIE family protein phosphatase [Streptomyces sp. MI02-7b]
MTTKSFDTLTLGKHSNGLDMPDTALAMLDEQGTVVGWTQAAEHLVGRSAESVVGRSAALVLPLFGERQSTSDFVKHCRAQNGWSGTTAVRHRDGRVMEACLRITMLRGMAGAVRWFVSLIDTGTLSGDAMSSLVSGPLLGRAPIGVAVRDPQLRCVFANDVMAEHDGIPCDKRLGRRLTEVVPGPRSEALEAMTQQVLQSGTTKVHEYRTWLPMGKGRGYPLAASFHCLQGADGESLGVCLVSADLAESRLARERLAAVGEAEARLGGTLDVMRISQELADLAVPLLADLVAVDLEQSTPSGDHSAVRVPSAGGHRPPLRRAGHASIHAGVPESPWVRGGPVTVPQASPFAAVLSTGRSHLEPMLDRTPGIWMDQVPAIGEKVRSHGVHSLMVVPIRAQNALLGVVLFLRTEDPTPFHEGDLLLAEELVRRAVRALDNARRYAREQTAALTLQRNLLPRRLRGGTAVETASRYLPADVEHGVGGDWFDVIPLSGARVALVVGDVVGHGLHAAATMGTLRAAVRTLADLELPPAELLSRLDNTLQRLVEEDPEPADGTAAVVGATCLYAVYDPATRVCTMARAGHPPPAIIDPQGRVAFPDLPTGAPLGLGLGLGDPFQSVELELPEGSLIAFYTDGLVESRDHDIDDGMNSLGAALAEPDQALEDLCDRATESFLEQTSCDDVTLLLVRTCSLGANRAASWTLPSDECASGKARQLVTGQLRTWGLDALADSTELIVSELVTNAVRHGTGTVTLCLKQHNALTCEVSDTNVCVPQLRSAGITDENGRGLFLVAQLSRRWGSRPAPEGKVVWAEQELPGTSRTRSRPLQAA